MRRSPSSSPARDAPLVPPPSYEETPAAVRIEHGPLGGYANVYWPPCLADVSEESVQDVSADRAIQLAWPIESSIHHMTFIDKLEAYIFAMHAFARNGHPVALKLSRPLRVARLNRVMLSRLAPDKVEARLKGCASLAFTTFSTDMDSFEKGGATDEDLEKVLLEYAHAYPQGLEIISDRRDVGSTEGPGSKGPSSLATRLHQDSRRKGVPELHARHRG